MTPTAADVGSFNSSHYFGSSTAAVAPSVPAYKQISKIKWLDVHVVRPWALTADEAGVVCVWDYSTKSQVMKFCPQAFKDAQYTALSELDDVDDADNDAVSMSSATQSRRKSRRPTGMFGAATTALNPKQYKVGAVKSVAFCDEATLCWSSGVHATTSSFGMSGNEWVAIVCESRVFLYDMMTHKVCDFACDELLSKKSISVLCLARVSSTRVVLGCSDGSLRLWQWTGDGLAGAVLTSPGSDTFSEAKQKPITHVVVCPFADSPLSHPSSSDSSGPLAVVAVSSDGDVTCWELLPNGPFNTKSGSVFTVHLGVEVKSATYSRSQRQVTVFSTNGRSVFLLQLNGAHAPTVTTAKVAGPSGQKVTAVASLSGNTRYPRNSLITSRQMYHVDIVSPEWAAFREGDSISVDSAPAITELLQLTQCRPGLPEHLKVYVMQSHPARPSHVVIGANIGLFVLDVAPAYSVTATASVMAPTRALVHWCDGALRCSVSISHPDDGSTPPSLPTETLITNVSPPGSGMTKASISPQALNGGILATSASGQFVSVIWPHLKCYSLYALVQGGDGKRVAKCVENGAGVDIAWGPQDTFAVLDPVVVMKAMPKTIKGAPDVKPEPSRPPTFSMKTVVVCEDSTAGFVVHPIVKTLSLPKSAVCIFGGPLLALALASDSVAANWDVPLGACEHGLSSLSTYTQLYEWVPKVTATTATSGRTVETQSLKPVGAPFPTPFSMVWDAISSSRVALCYSSHVDVLAVSTAAADAATKRKTGSKVLTKLCTVPLGSPPHHVLWYKRSAFVLTSTQCLLVCPQLTTSDAKPSLHLSAALGVSGAVVIPVTSAVPSPPVYSVTPVLMDTSHSVLLGVVNGGLVVGSLTAKGDWMQTRIPLAHVALRMAVCASMDGQTAAAVHWASQLPPSMQSSAAVLLASLGHGSAGATLPSINPKVSICLALAFGDKPFLRAFLAAHTVPNLLKLNSALYHVRPSDCEAGPSSSSDAISWRHSLIGNATSPQLSLLSHRPANCLQFVSLVDAAAITLLSSPTTSDEFRADAALLRSIRDEHVRTHTAGAVPILSLLFATPGTKTPPFPLADLENIGKAVSSEYLNVLPRVWG